MAYSKSVIYIITTADGLYVGSTCDFKTRKSLHKSSIYNESGKNYNFKVYQNIRANDGEYCIELYKPFPCDNKRELEQEETRLMMELNANLNTNRAYITEEEKMKYKIEYREKNRDEFNVKAKLYHEKNKDERNAKKKVYYETNKEKICEKITCECGCVISRCNKTRHKKNKKHLNLMNNNK